MPKFVTHEEFREHKVEAAKTTKSMYDEMTNLDLGVRSLNDDYFHIKKTLADIQPTVREGIKEGFKDGFEAQHGNTKVSFHGKTLAIGALILLALFIVLFFCMGWPGRRHEQGATSSTESEMRVTSNATIL